MKRVKSRATAALIIATLVIAGCIAYVIDFLDNGAQWVMYSANGSVYQNGVLAMGTVTDRNGTLLARAQNGVYFYSDDTDTRVSCLHAVGDFPGNIGTGALTVFADALAGYSPVSGIKKDGGTVTLSIDASLNRTAWSALAGRRGAVLLMDYTTGEILCMASAPSYDPNTGFDPDDSRYEGAYLNRCLSASYTPGSVYKLVTLAAAIENIDDLYERSFYCAGSEDIAGTAVKCTGVHGYQTVEQALANSCNCAFALISLELGPDKLAEYSGKLGFDSVLELNGIPTKAGSFEKAAPGSADLAWSGIGQYTDLVCPYAMLRYTAALANGGQVAGPTLLHGGSAVTTRLLGADTAEKIKQMMSYNVVYSYGEWNFPGLALCAKSGTAERGDGTSNSWFTGFLDDTDHPYAFCVVIESGGGGLANAGTLANTLLQAAVARAGN